MKTIQYRRVSTKQQGESGLGLEGQEAALRAFTAANHATVVATYTEVETGTDDDRPELAKAMAHAKRSKATLVVAKMDRLSRSATFLSSLLDSGVKFLAVDNPCANELTVRILACVAQEEAKAISERTKAALAAYKARGGLLGSAREGHWEGKEEVRLNALVKAREVSSKVISREARAAFSDLLPMMMEMRSSGATLQEIADRLNSEGQTTRRGKEWSATQVKRVLERV